MKIINSSKATFFTKFGSIKPGINIVDTGLMTPSTLKQVDKILSMYRDHLTTDKQQEVGANILGLDAVDVIISDSKASVPIAIVETLSDDTLPVVKNKKSK